MASTKPGQRKTEILQALAAMLEQPKSEKITTAALAARLTVSEAALYRHFASKAQMFEGLIDFIETTIFGIINQIGENEASGVGQAHATLQMLLHFADQNAGMTRVLIGDALVGEDERLQLRMNQFYDKLELAFKQSLRVAVTQGHGVEADVAARASLLVSYTVGRWHRYAKSGFKHHVPECFALLDDASAADPASMDPRSRLYTGHAGTLTCSDAADWPALLTQMAAALTRGLYAVPLLTYELGGHLLGVAARPLTDPLATVLLFERCAQLPSAQVAHWLAERITQDEQPAGIAAIRASVDQAQFSADLARIHDYIAAGDTYQVNYTYRLRFDAYGSIFSLYARLRARQPVPYGALVALPDGRALLSLSPELFVRHSGGALLARPMKGTAPASDDDAVNATRAAALAVDPKNRAENLMIVDLLRNDLGRIARTGSVTTSALFDVQRYSGVLQMTSTVQATLRADATLADIFTALYPCGSITGAPKRRTMEIIGELESTPRGMYTGAIGWFDPPARPGAEASPIGDFCLSVPIRTLTLQASREGVRAGEMGVGAGIVYDSEAADEYAECQLKARFLTGLAGTFTLFETMRADSEQGVRHRERHLARLARSARYFAYPFELAAAEQAMASACAAMQPATRYRLRLALAADGALTVQSAPLTPLREPVGLLLAAAATDTADLFLRHKSSVRTRYDDAWRAAEAQGGFDSLFFNERDELTEGGRSNVFVRIDGQWLTPPLSCGVLPGVMRAVLLEAPAWRAREATVTRAMLLAAEDIVVCNALRGPLRAYLLG